MPELRILLASHSPTLATGYGRVVREFARALAKAGHAVCAVGSGYDGAPHVMSFPIMPAAPATLAPAIARAIEATSPHVLITIGDPWMFDGLPAVCQAAPRTRWLACFPIDSRPLPGPFKSWIAAAHATVVFSEYARTVVRDEVDIDPLVIPHGVDTATFRPLDRTLAKARVGVAGQFVIGTVAANQRRKNLPALIDAFARFARGKDDVMLYLHTPIVGEHDLQPILERHGVADRARATLRYDPLRGLSDADLATVYNSFDVFALPTMAEGFGLPILESQACGVPALATDCSSCTELLPHPMQRVQVRATETHAHGIVRSLADEADLAARFERLYRDRPLRDGIARGSLDFASQFTWERLLPALLDRVTTIAADSARA
jgi:glycosyltransferase involved in cell wall biosynthesis